jgi:hypothetical protein
MEPHPVLPDRPKPWARREAVRDRARRRDHHRRHLIRALLVPSLRRLFGRWSLWFPEPLGKLLLVRQPKPGLRRSDDQRSTPMDTPRSA